MGADIMQPYGYCGLNGLNHHRFNRFFVHPIAIYIDGGLNEQPLPLPYTD